MHLCISLLVHFRPQVACIINALRITEIVELKEHSKLKESCQCGEEGSRERRRNLGKCISHKTHLKVHLSMLRLRGFVSQPLTRFQPCFARKHAPIHICTSLPRHSSPKTSVPELAQAVNTMKPEWALDVYETLKTSNEDQKSK